MSTFFVSKAEKNFPSSSLIKAGSEKPLLWFQPHWHVRDLSFPVWGSGCSIITCCNGSQLIHRSQTGWNKEEREAFKVDHELLKYLQYLVDQVFYLRLSEKTYSIAI